MSDYPAAHSMDSCWFAVDKDGHVAFFETGESGAMPETGAAGDDAYDLRDRLLQLLPRGEFLYDPRGRSLPDDPQTLLPDGHSMLVYLSNLAPAQTDIEAGRATVARATEGYAVHYDPLTATQARRLRDSGAVVGWTFGDLGGDGGLAAHGIYEYAHLCENWIAGPYGRERVPARRVHVDQLPPDVRKLLKGARLPNVSFADTVYLQPAEHWDECGSWEPAWLSTDGMIRPFPDRLEEYAELYDELRTDMPHYRFEPPPEE